jgi:hypothetical protein
MAVKTRSSVAHALLYDIFWISTGWPKTAGLPGLLVFGLLLLLFVIVSVKALRRPRREQGSLFSPSSSK